MSEPLLVAHLVLSLDFGGMENGVINLVNRLPGQGVAARVICIRRPGAMASRLAAAAPIHSLDCASGLRLRAVWRLARYLRRERISLLHSHNHAALIWGGLATLAAPGVRLVHGEHGDTQPHGAKDTWLLRRAHAITAVNDNLVAEIRNCYHLPAAEVHVIRNGVDPELYAPRPGSDALRRELGLSPETVVFTVVGRLEPRKNQALAIRALAAASRQVAGQACPPALVLIGDGADRTPLAALAAELGVRAQVHFLGFRHDVSQLLPQLDVLVLPSAWGEGLANVLLEAASCGLPVIASAIPGNEVIVSPGQTGYLVPPDDEPAWATAMTELLTQRDHRRRLGQAARARVLAEFSVDRMVAAYAALYRRVGGCSAPASVPRP